MVAATTHRPTLTGLTVRVRHCLISWPRRILLAPFYRWENWLNVAQVHMVRPSKRWMRTQDFTVHRQAGLQEGPVLSLQHSHHATQNMPRPKLEMRAPPCAPLASSASSAEVSTLSLFTQPHLPARGGHGPSGSSSLPTARRRCPPQEWLLHLHSGVSGSTEAPSQSPLWVAFQAPWRPQGQECGCFHGQDPAGLQRRQAGA